MSLPLAKYEQFHGKRYRKISGFEFHIAKGLVFLGKAIAIEYQCSKRNGGGDGRSAIYRHEFETPAIVCMDEKGKRQLYIIGNSITVDDEGIKR